MISDGSTHAILTDYVGMCGEVTKCVPKLLSCEQKEPHLDFVQHVLECASSNPDFLIILISGVQEQPRNQGGIIVVEVFSTPKPNKARQVMSKVKSYAVFFY